MWKSRHRPYEHWTWNSCTWDSRVQRVLVRLKCMHTALAERRGVFNWNFDLLWPESATRSASNIRDSSDRTCLAAAVSSVFDTVWVAGASFKYTWERAVFTQRRRQRNQNLVTKVLCSECMYARHGCVAVSLDADANADTVRQQRQ